MGKGGRETAPPYVIPRSYCDKSSLFNDLATTVCPDGGALPRVCPMLAQL
jgi:hypothetical protein